MTSQRIVLTVILALMVIGGVTPVCATIIFIYGKADTQGGTILVSGLINIAMASVAGITALLANTNTHPRDSHTTTITATETPAKDDRE